MFVGCSYIFLGRSYIFLGFSYNFLRAETTTPPLLKLLSLTDAEKKRGIAFLTCGTTGANLLSIDAGLATIQLTGNCNGCGAVGVYDSIVKTLKQFPSVSYVHVLDVDGKSQRNGNLSDARPECLEP